MACWEKPQLLPLTSAEDASGGGVDQDFVEGAHSFGLYFVTRKVNANVYQVQWGTWNAVASF